MPRTSSLAQEEVMHLGFIDDKNDLKVNHSLLTTLLHDFAFNSRVSAA